MQRKKCDAGSPMWRNEAAGRREHESMAQERRRAQSRSWRDSGRGTEGDTSWLEKNGRRSEEGGLSWDAQMEGRGTEEGGGTGQRGRHGETEEKEDGRRGSREGREKRDIRKGKRERTAPCTRSPLLEELPSQPHGAHVADALP
eukprot:5726793-Pleurochrysis_carterae.AAC.2